MAEHLGEGGYTPRRPKEYPFADIPSGVDIGHYFWDETDRRNPGCDGIALYREGNSYCYLWMEAMVDHDMWHSYLLDIRTSARGKETRDFLFLHVGAGGVFEVEWHNQPIDFDAPTEAHWERFEAGMRWLTDRCEKAIEDHEGMSTPPTQEGSTDD